MILSPRRLLQCSISLAAVSMWIGCAAPPPESTTPESSVSVAPLPSAPTASGVALASVAPSSAPSELPTTPAGSTSRIHDDVVAFAIERYPGTPGWQSSQNRCASRLKELGYDVQLDRFVPAGEHGPKRHGGGPPAPPEGVNVLGIKKGTDKASEQVILSAHYDHIEGCAGADDDASGVASVLESARALSTKTYARTLIVACWDWEEAGLLGSRDYAGRAKDRGDDIRLAVALDGVGYTDLRPHSQGLPPGVKLVAPDVVARMEKRGSAGDFIALVSDSGGTRYTDAFERAARQLKLEAAVLELSSMEKMVMNDALRADHASFWLNGYPGVLLSDSANFRNPGYHCMRAADSPETLDYDFLTKVTTATTGMIDSALSSP